MDNSDKNKRVALYESNKFLQPIHPKQTQNLYRRPRSLFLSRLNAQCPQSLLSNASWAWSIRFLERLKVKKVKGMFIVEGALS